VDAFLKIANWKNASQRLEAMLDMYKVNR